MLVLRPLLARSLPVLSLRQINSLYHPPLHNNSNRAFLFRPYCWQGLTFVCAVLLFSLAFPNLSSSLLISSCRVLRQVRQLQSPQQPVPCAPYQVPGPLRDGNDGLLPGEGETRQSILRGAAGKTKTKSERADPYCGIKGLVGCRKTRVQVNIYIRRYPAVNSQVTIHLCRSGCLFETKCSHHVHLISNFKKLRSCVCPH